MAIPAPTIDADLEAVTAALAAVQPRPGRVLLFGSRARGDARPDSDLDLLVVMPQGTLTPQERQQG
jgi:predicted nucleotidyltransferase